MKQAIKQYFTFSRRERNGIFLLLFVLLGLIVASFFLPHLYNVDESEVQKSYQQNTKPQQKQSVKRAGEKNEIHYQLKPFNPNTASKDSLIQSGLSEKLAQQILNYREKGGKFKVKKDFAKLYYLTDSAYQAIAPYLLLPDELPKPKPLIVEINTADSLLLLRVKGIGSIYAHKILEYRRQSGGYFTLNQLGETFYINANTLQEQQQRMAEIKSQLRVDTTKIKKLEINTATQQQLSHHPYISYKQSKKVISLRKKKRIVSWETLDIENIFSEREKQLLIRYIQF